MQPVLGGNPPNRDGPLDGRSSIVRGGRGLLGEDTGREKEPGGWLTRWPSGARMRAALESSISHRGHAGLAIWCGQTGFEGYGVGLAGYHVSNRSKSRGETGSILKTQVNGRGELPASGT